MQHAVQGGRRITEVAVLSGSVVRIWGALERILARHEHRLSRSDRTMRVLRVDLGAGNSLVGAPSCESKTETPVTPSTNDTCFTS